MKFTSKKIATQLEKYGVIPKKSYTAKFSKELEDDVNAWRGMIDGDGWLQICPRFNGGIKPTIRIGLSNASYNLICQYVNFVEKHVPGTQSTIIKQKGCNCYEVIYYSSTAMKLAKLLYNNCTVALDRKYRIALEMICRLERKEDLNIIYQNIVNRQSIGIQCILLRITRVAISTLSKIYFCLRNN
jgi:hypothetical protein